MNNMKAFEERVDSMRMNTAEKLESAADSVRAAGTESAKSIGDLANGAGQKLDATAGQVRAFRQTDLLAGLVQTVRRNPMGSLVIASAVGLIAGFSFRGACRREVKA